MAPPHQRNQRRRTQQRSPRQEHPAVQERIAQLESTATDDLATATTAPARTANRPVRRATARPVEPVDYSHDYADARRDLRWIALWATIVFVGMIALGFSGIV